MTWTTRQRSDLSPLQAIVAGTGPDTMVLLHGVGLRAEAWAAQLDALCDDFRMVAIDLPGHGHSPNIATAASVASYTDVIARTFTGPALVVGHSFGAMIALDLACRYPDRVRAVAALNAIKGRDRAAASAVQARARALDGTSAPDPAVALGRWFGTAQSPERTACSTWLSQTDPAGYKAAYTVFAAADGPTDAELTKMTCPALFATGACEPNSTPAMSRRMAELAPKGRALSVAGAAHMMPMTHGDTVNAALRQLAQEALA